MEEKLLDINKTLEEYGLTQNEAKVYLALLKTGITTSNAIIQKTNLHKPRVYSALYSLEKKGLINIITKNNKQYFEAKDPEVLIAREAERLDKIKSLANILKKSQVTSDIDFNVQIFEGVRELMYVFEQTIKNTKPNSEILVFGARSGQDFAPKTYELFFKRINKERIKNNIKYKIIFNKDLKDTDIVKEYLNSPLTEVKFSMEHTLAGINIQDNSVLIVLWEKNPKIIKIDNKVIADSFKEFFKNVWKRAEATKKE